MNEFGPWDQFVAFVNRAGYAWKNLLGQDKGILDLSRMGQIKFPATQIASSDANTLDDYEEGSWTPGFSFNNGTTGITYSIQTARYTKIGRLVLCGMNVAVSSKGSSTGLARVTGLPFTVDLNVAIYTGILRWDNMTSSLISCWAQPEAGQARAILFGQTAGTTSANGLADTDFSDTTQLIGSFAFHV